MLAEIKINNKAIASISLAVNYASGYGMHSDILYIDKFNIWSDAGFLPLPMQLDLIGKQADYKDVFSFKKGELTKTNDVCFLHTIDAKDFNPPALNNLTIHPRRGRFYPAAWFSGINDNHLSKMSPVRIVHIDNDMIQVDFNHALSEYDVDIGIHVFSVYSNFDKTDTKGSDCIEKLLLGPAMQLRCGDKATDFFSDEAFSRIDNEIDELFYSSPRMVDHLDDTALQQVSSIYKELISDNSDILDLMSSMNSHLPADIDTKNVTGLGMNREELDANPALDDRVIQDLNESTTLPFDDNCFDIVLCTVSVEYLVKPSEIFDEIARVLRPGGKFIATFSNRWFPTKAIQLWPYLHEFERMGLVSEYFIQSGHFKQINTRSVRGLPRPENDRHALPFSDPVYAVWATRV